MHCTRQTAMSRRRDRAGVPNRLPHAFVMLMLATRDGRASALISTESRGCVPPPSRSLSAYSPSSSRPFCYCSPVGDACDSRRHRGDRAGTGGSAGALGPAEREGRHGSTVGWRHSGKRRCSRRQAEADSTIRRKRPLSATMAAGRTSHSSSSGKRRSSRREAGIFGGWTTNNFERSAGEPPNHGGESNVAEMKGGRGTAIPDWERRRFGRPGSLASLNAGRSDGEINGSVNVNSSQEVKRSLGNASPASEGVGDSAESPVNKDKAEELLPEIPTGVVRKLRAALASVGATVSKLKLPRVGPRQRWDDLDEAYAMMPDIQAELREKTGWEGTGTGYEDVRLGFYRDTNLKPLNWRDAMVSMKPGSGTVGLDPDFDDNAGSPAEVEKRRRRRAEAAAGAPTTDGGGGRERVGTRYGGPPPGTHGPWRWRQLVKGSALEKELKAEIKSFPPRLPRKVRRYYDDKVVWITGADHGVGEQLAINLTVNGARVILSGTDFDELERVQRLCILAWMKAINWELINAIFHGWTRLDRAMILPLDVRDDFFLERAHDEAVGMLCRPMDMVFHCQDEDARGAGGGEGEVQENVEEEEEEEEEEELELATSGSDLEGAVALTKVLVPGMLDTGEGHIVVFSGGDASHGAPKGPPSPTGVISSRQAPADYFNGLRAEVAWDGVKVTTVHHYGNLNGRDGRNAAAQASDPTVGARARRTSVDAGAAARKVLTSVSKGKQMVFLHGRGLSAVAAGLGGRTRRAMDSLKAPASP